MSKIKRYGPTESQPNWLASEIGIIPKTMTIPNSMGKTEAGTGRLKVMSGTIYPANDDTATGIVYGPNGLDYDVTDGDVEGSVLIAGRVYANRLPEAPDADAMAALEAKGLFFDECPDMTRGY